MKPYAKREIDSHSLYDVMSEDRATKVNSLIETVKTAAVETIDNDRETLLLGVTAPS